MENDELDGQDSLFDRQRKARQARDEGMDRAERNAREEWNAYARAYLIWYLERTPTLFGDEIWLSGLAEPPNTKRAFGPRVTEARKEAWIMPHDTPVFRKSTQSRMGHMQVWISVLYRNYFEFDGVAPPVAPE